MANKKQIAKQREKDGLKKSQTMTVTIVTTEANMQRFAAMLLLADHDFEIRDEDVEAMYPLPWEDPNDPKFIAAEAAVVDYIAVRNSIMVNLSAYVVRFGVDKAKAALLIAGGEKIQDVPNEKLVALDAYLERALAEK